MGTLAGDQAKLMATATPLALTIGKPLLEKYGFSADALGELVVKYCHICMLIFCPVQDS